MANDLQLPLFLPSSIFMNVVEEMLVADVADWAASVTWLAIEHTATMLPATAFLTPEPVHEAIRALTGSIAAECDGCMLEQSRCFIMSVRRIQDSGRRGIDNLSVLIGA
jgi:hypothetical protein